MTWKIKQSKVTKPKFGSLKKSTKLINLQLRENIDYQHQEFRRVICVGTTDNKSVIKYLNKFIAINLTI
jgi:hypothetical protein